MLYSKDDAHVTLAAVIMLYSKDDAHVTLVAVMYVVQ